MKAIAIDDEPIALKIVRAFLIDINFIQLDATFTNALEAIAHLNSNSIDLIFLDIKMPDISGIEFVKTLHKSPMIIFTTAYSEHAVQSFELDAVDYLLKPYSEERFRKACEKAYRIYNLNKNSERADDYLFIKTGNEKLRIEFDEIKYLESSGNYMQFICSSRKILSRLTMAEALSLLPSDRFIRIHRSIVINKSFLTRVEKNTVTIGEQSLTVGPSFAEIVRNLAL